MEVRKKMTVEILSLWINSLVATRFVLTRKPAMLSPVMRACVYFFFGSSAAKP